MNRIGFFEMVNDVILVVQHHVAIDQDRDMGLTGNFVDFFSQVVRPGNVDFFIIDLKIRQNLPNHGAITAPVNIVKFHHRLSLALQPGRTRHHDCIHHSMNFLFVVRAQGGQNASQPRLILHHKIIGRQPRPTLHGIHGLRF